MFIGVILWELFLLIINFFEKCCYLFYFNFCFCNRIDNSCFKLVDMYFWIENRVEKIMFVRWSGGVKELCSGYEMYNGNIG